MWGTIYSRRGCGVQGPASCRRPGRGWQAALPSWPAALHGGRLAAAPPLPRMWACHSAPPPQRAAWIVLPEPCIGCCLPPTPARISKMPAGCAATLAASQTRFWPGLASNGWQVGVLTQRLPHPACCHRRQLTAPEPAVLLLIVNALQGWQAGSEEAQQQAAGRRRTWVLAA